MNLRVWSIIFSWLLCCGLWTLNPASAWAVDATLESTILEVIQHHPEAILESLTAYQKQYQEQKHQVKLQTLDKLKQNISDAIEQSPILKHSQRATLTLIEFADYECSFCIKAYPELQRLLEQYPNVALVYKHLPLVAIHPQALPAAKASWAASQQGKFWEFHNALFERQGDLNERAYQMIATHLKLNLAQFNRDRNSFAATEAIAQDMHLAGNLNIEGTPTFLAVNSKGIELISGVNFQALEAIASAVM
jgi:protein-disulfide isomerase